jgi:hypothetical protein
LTDVTREWRHVNAYEASLFFGRECDQAMAHPTT